MPYKSRPTDKNEWKVGMFTTCCEDPCYFCQACWCPWCTAYSHRGLLIGNGPYYCCGGMYPCCCLKDPCPRWCLCLEACCCLSCAVVGNRAIIQTQQQIQNSCCDECIIWTTCIASWVLCILRLFGVNIPDSVQNCVDCLYYTVLGCMQTQHAIQMGIAGPQKQVVTMPGPPPQTMGTYQQR